MSADDSLPGGSSSSSSNSKDKLEAHRLRTALSQIRPTEDLRNLTRVPCARSSLLLGLMTLGGVVGVSTIARRGLRRSLNWGVGSFVGVTLASFETCRRSRAAERERMRVIVKSFERGGGGAGGAGAGARGRAAQAQAQGAEGTIPPSPAGTGTGAGAGAGTGASAGADDYYQQGSRLHAPSQR